MPKALQKAFLLTLLLLLGIGGNQIARGDVITLKSGDKLEGTIKKETDAEITIEYKVSPTISDERIVGRDEIASIEKTAPDELAYRQIKDLKLDPQSSFASETYAKIIELLTNFQTSFPNSSHVREVQLDLDAFKQEKDRVDAGEVKFLGQWLSPEEAEKRKIQIQGQQVFGTMKQQAAAGDLVGALDTFSQLEKDYSSTRVFPDAVDLARQLIPSLQKQLLALTKKIATDQEQLKHTLAMTSEPERSQLAAAEKRKQAQFDASVAAATKAGAKWPPLYPGNANSISALQKAATSEATRLAALPVPKMRESLKSVDEAKAALNSKDTPKAEALLKESQQNWPQNEEAIFYMAQIAPPKATPRPAASPAMVAATGTKPIINATPAATTTPRPTPAASATAATPRATASPSAAATVRATAAVSSPSPSASPSPSVAPSEPRTVTAPAPSVAAAKPSPKGSPASEPAVTGAKLPFLMTIPGALLILGVVIVLIIIGESVSRIRAARQKDEEE